MGQEAAGILEKAQKYADFEMNMNYESDMRNAET